MKKMTIAELAEAECSVGEDTDGTYYVNLFFTSDGTLRRETVAEKLTVESAEALQRRLRRVTGELKGILLDYFDKLDGDKP